MISYQYMDSHNANETVSQSSYHQNENLHTFEDSLYSKMGHVVTVLLFPQYYKHYPDPCDFKAYMICSATWIANSVARNPLTYRRSISSHEHK